MVEARVYESCAQTCGTLDESLFTSLRSCRGHYPSEDLICEYASLSIPVLHNISGSFVLDSLSSRCIRVVWSHTLDPYSNWRRTNPVKICFLICVVII